MGMNVTMAPSSGWSSSVTVPVTGSVLGSGFADGEYLDVDADVVDRRAVFEKGELIVKVKEPMPSEYALLREGQALFTYLHLAPNRELTEVLLRKRVAGLAYETLEKDGTLPLLAPTSSIAGRMAPLMATYFLQKFRGGSGVLPTGAVGVRPARAVVIGAGVVGTNAARVCAGLDIDTVVLNRGTERLLRIDELFMGRVRTRILTRLHVKEEIRDADIVIGALLVPGGRTPVVITREMLGTMKKGAVIADVSVDQGGCVETARPTTHEDPVFEVDGIIHYMVANMPGAYPRTSTIALTDATMPYIRMLARKGIVGALTEDASLRTAVNTLDGKIVNRALAESLGMEYFPVV
jgi:alanine dehydrogenase